MIDLIVIISYLVLILALSVYFGVRTKTMREYSVANKNYKTPIMISALVGTSIGGYTTVIMCGQVYQHGILPIVLMLAFAVDLVISAKLLTPTIVAFKDAISPGDLMDHYYGRGARIVTGIAAICKSAGVIGAQVAVIGYVLEYSTGISYVLAVFLGYGLVV